MTGGAILATSLCAAELSFDSAKVEAITGMKGTTTAGVFRLNVPRNDVPVVVDGWKTPPFMGLTSWAAFAAGKESDLMVMGDFVLFQDEVAAAMKAALTHGLEVTALHNHFFYDEPRV